MTWPVYPATEIVCCRDCRKPVARAEEGLRTFFRHPSGNVSLVCRCGAHSFYDIRKGKAHDARLLES